jgi:L-ascorbate metabolism protein UlaG (beta-lactamase superfamily)
MHYGANAFGKGTPEEFIKELGSAPTKVVPLKPGEKVEF